MLNLSRLKGDTFFGDLMERAIYFRLQDFDVWQMKPIWK